MAILRIASFQPVKVLFRGNPPGVDISQWHPLGQIAYMNQQSAQPESQKLQRVQQKALEVFRYFKGDKQGLIQWLKKQGVSVFDVKAGAKWVEDVCKRASSSGIFYPPMAALYPREEYPTTYMPEKDTEVEFAKVLTDHARAVKPFIILGSLGQTETVMHETFHCLQFLYGLPFGTQYRHARKENDLRRQFCRRIHTPFWQRTLFRWGEVTRLKWKHCLGMLKEIPQGAGASVRTEMRREFEATQFLIDHGKSLGLSKEGRLRQRNTQWIYQKLHDFSYTLDEQEQKAQSGT